MKPTEEQVRIIKDFADTRVMKTVEDLARNYSFNEVHEMFKTGEISAGRFLSYIAHNERFGSKVLKDDPSIFGAHYLYLVKVDSVPAYLGRGRKNRYLHPISGRSTVVELNKHLFDGKHITVHRALFTDDVNEIKELENLFINSLYKDFPDILNKRFRKVGTLGEGYLDTFDEKPCAEAGGG
jgi:hypothetical protein